MEGYNVCDPIDGSKPIGGQNAEEAILKEAITDQPGEGDGNIDNINDVNPLSSNSKSDVSP